MEDEETLLKLYRDFTDKEKVDWLLSDNRGLKNKIKVIISENDRLKNKNKELQARIKEDENLYPSAIDRNNFVKAKTHNKLLKRYNELDKRFWELLHKIKEEKL